MTARAPWFCPSCQKHHGPHVDTCPGGGVGMQPYMPPAPYVPSLPAYPTTPWVPYEPMTPWVPYEPAMCTTTVLPDPNVVLCNGTYSVATGLQ